MRSFLVRAGEQSHAVKKAGFGWRPLLFSLTFSFICSAVQAQPQQQQQSEWGLGLGLLSNQKPYTDMDRETKAIPFISYQNEYIELLGPNLKYKLPGLDLNSNHSFNFALVAEYDFSDNDPDETPILNGMAERKGGFWAGAALQWHNPLATVSLEWLSEVSGDSDGAKFNLGIERSWHIGSRFILTPRLVFSQVDKNYVDYYYGVRPEEVRPDRTFYQGKAALNTEVGVRGLYMWDQNQMLILDIAVTSLANEIKNSPLVDSSSENRVVFGYLYRF
jgi:outer membrane protein